MSVEREQIGACTLYRGDCREILPTLAPVDAVITDPPYGDNETHQGHLAQVVLRNGEPAGQALSFAGMSIDQLVEDALVWCRLARRWVVFTCEWHYAHALDTAGILVRLGIWRKPDGAPQFTGDRPGMGWEAVAICHRPGKKRWNGGGRHAFWTYPKGENTSGHPTGKPYGLFADLVRDFTDTGEIVCDPFMGSGTTGLACLRLGRAFVGIERDRRYFDLACRRIEAAYAQLDLFTPTPAVPAQQLTLEGIPVCRR